MRILALDFEGTHREPRRGCPIQLGVAVMEDNQVLASDEFLIAPPVHYKTGKPMKEVDAYSLKVSGLTLDQVEAEGLKAYVACCRLDAFCQFNSAHNLPVLAYSFTYDAECYGQLLYEGGRYDYDLQKRLAYREILSPTWIDMYRIARRKLEGVIYDFTLDFVAEHCGLARASEKHGALEDAILAGSIYFELEKETE